MVHVVAVITAKPGKRAEILGTSTATSPPCGRRAAHGRLRREDPGADREPRDPHSFPRLSLDQMSSFLRLTRRLRVLD